MTHWKSDDGWDYEIFDPDADAQEFSGEAAFVCLWQGKRRDGRLPAWQDFEPIRDFEPWYGWINVEDIVSVQPYDAVFRLFGTNVARMYGTDHTGKAIREIPGDFFTTVEYELSEKICAERLIGRSTGPVKWTDRRFIEVSILEFPLADNGRDVDRMLVLNTVLMPGIF